jgi:CHC2 zinc finger
MPGIDYRAARALLRLGDVLELIGYRPTAQLGQQLRGPCPLHGSRSPRSRVFAAHLGKNVHHCFRCAAGGNALDLWAGTDAATAVCSGAGIVRAPGPAGAMAGRWANGRTTDERSVKGPRRPCRESQSA